VPTEQSTPEFWVEQYGDFLFNYAIKRLRDESAAEEVVQETFLNGIKYYSQYSGKGSQQAWLTGILKRKIIDFIRKRNKHQHDQTEGHDPSNHLFDQQGNYHKGASSWTSSPDRNLQSNELWTIVKGCLTHLPQSQADVFTLSVMEELNSDQICKELAITPSNYWVRMHRARLGLANCVGRQWNSNEEAATHAE
jgi:RNA polymerase sigma-70 factor (TIGR02943 family)